VSRFRSLADRRKAPEDALRLVEEANRLPITRVLNDLTDTFAPDDTSHKSWKAHCFLGHEHTDGGTAPALRVYSHTNTAFCFALHGFMNPTRVAQLITDLPPVQAARALLEAYGLDKPATFLERHTRALARLNPDPDKDARCTLAAALHEALRPLPLYDALNLHPAVLQATAQALDELDSTEPTGEPARTWLASARAAVSQALALASADTEPST
jgi:hypothetical protein